MGQPKMLGCGALGSGVCIHVRPAERTWPPLGVTLLRQHATHSRRGLLTCVDAMCTGQSIYKEENSDPEQAGHSVLACSLETFLRMGHLLYTEHTGS